MNEKNDKNIYSENDLYRLELLRKAEKDIVASIAVFREGVAESENDLEIMKVYKENLQFARDFLREGDVTVSMEEYQKVQTELKLIEVHLSDKMIAIRRLEHLIKEKEKDLQSAKDTIQNIIQNGKLGVVLNFRKQDGQ